MISEIFIYAPLAIGCMALASLLFDILFRVRYRATALTLERLAINFKFTEEFPWLNQDQEMRLQLLSAAALFSIKSNDVSKIQGNQHLSDLLRFFENTQAEYLSEPRFVKLVQEICFLNIKGLFYRDILSACRISAIIAWATAYVCFFALVDAVRSMLFKNEEGKKPNHHSPSFIEIARCTLSKSNSISFAHCI